MDKPEILSEKKLVEIIQPIFEAALNNGVMPTNWNMAVRKISEAFSVTNKKAVEAQRDADAAYYEPLIQQAEERAWENFLRIRAQGDIGELIQQFETIQKRQQAVEAKLNDVELAIQQAREEVAREIDDFLQMHLYARPDKPEATMKFTDWMKLKKLLSKYGGQK